MKTRSVLEGPQCRATRVYRGGGALRTTVLCYSVWHGGSEIRSNSSVIWQRRWLPRGSR